MSTRVIEATVADFHPGDHVRYVPYHAYDDPKHPDCENGTVSSTNEHLVFVRFGGKETAQACKPDQLWKR